jgi:hypothetical protein
MGCKMKSMRGFGKLLLSAYLMKKIDSRVSRSSGGMMGKYAKLMLVGYLFKKFKIRNIKSSKLENEIEPVEENELLETKRGSLKMGIGKIIMGALAGATIIYAMRKYAAKKSWHKIQVQ